MNINDIYLGYDKYDKNIKAIKGGGVIVPSNPPSAKKTDTISDVWKNNIIPVPPTFKYKYYSNPNLTNGYLNENNYVENDKYISDYYYPSQKLDNVNFIKEKIKPNIKNKINQSNPIKFPPPLISTKPDNDIKFSKKKKLKSKSKSKSKSELNLDNIEYDKEYEQNIYLTQLVNHIKNNCLYDGKYIYTIENNNDNKNTDEIKNIGYFNYKPVKNNSNLNKNENENNREDLEEFIIEEKLKTKTVFNSISNINLLVIFSILLIIYFSKYQK